MAIPACDVKPTEAHRHEPRVAQSDKGPGRLGWRKSLVTVGAGRWVYLLHGKVDREGTNS